MQMEVWSLQNRGGRMGSTDVKSIRRRSSTYCVLLCARQCSECFSWFISVFPENKHSLGKESIISGRRLVLLSQFNRWENRGRGWLYIELKLKKLMSVWTRIQTQTEFKLLTALQHFTLGAGNCRWKVNVGRGVWNWRRRKKSFLHDCENYFL